MIEVIIKIKDDSQTLKVKHMLYSEELLVSHNSLPLKDLVDAALKDFKGEPKDIDVIVKFVW